MLQKSPFLKDFHIFAKAKINGRPLAYLDNAATTQKPKVVIDAISDFYLHYNANIHRGLHTLSEKATGACDAVRESVRKFIGARDVSEIIFTYGTTMGINLIAYTWAQQHLKLGDEIIISIMEHHANIVPWQELAKRKKIKLSFIPLTSTGELDWKTFDQMISKKTELVALTHISNVLGIKNDIEKIVTIAKKVKAKVLIDAAQSIAHEHINVSNLDIDFLVFSGHKMYGPTGVGILYAKRELLDTMPPFLTGGDMILEVTTKKTTFQDPPLKFEAGTPNIAGIIGLGASIQYLRQIGVARIKRYEHELAQYTYEKLASLNNIILYSPKTTRGIFCFNLKGIHAHDVAEIANRYGVAIRSGNHCAMPLHRHLGVAASARASIACYNSKRDIDALVAALKDAQKIFHNHGRRHLQKTDLGEL